MSFSRLNICLTTTLLCTVAGVTCAGQTTFHVVTYLQQFGPATGLVEGSPGVFFSEGGQMPFAVTTQGAKTVLASFPSSEFVTGPLVSGSDSRYYSAFQPSSNTARLFSVGSVPGKQEYSVQDIAPVLTENLPDSSLLGVGLSGTVDYLIKATLGGQLITLYQFSSSDHLPNTALLGTDGDFYGISMLQDASGYVYRISASGTFTKLYSFPAHSFMNGPRFVPLIQASDGDLYGCTPSGGANGTGTIYRLSLGGQYTLLYTFPKGPKGMPTSLIEASDGNFYGSTQGINGGDSLLFRITPSGQYSVAYAMTNLAEDGDCLCLLTQGSDGIIYGTAQIGGVTGFGDIFALDAGLPKPAPHAQHFNPSAGPAGTQVLLWGKNLLSAAVQFNGLAATQVSTSGPNYVWATVPAGATSGPITITTPGGSFTTSASFTVQ